MGEVFEESNSESMAVLVLEGQQPLGDDAHRYYDDLIRQLKDDPAHVQHVQDFWGDPLTAGAAQSADGKAAYVQVALVRSARARPLANESVQAVQDIVERTPAPPGVKAYVTGPAAIVADMGESGNRTVVLITVGQPRGDLRHACCFVFRSVVTTVIILADGRRSNCRWREELSRSSAMHEIVGLTTFVVNLLVSVGIAAGTDYGIFFVGRYQEARASRRGSGNGFLHDLPQCR